jgi:hypothetical protein
VLFLSIEELNIEDLSSTRKMGASKGLLLVEEFQISDICLKNIAFSK